MMEETTLVMLLITAVFQLLDAILAFVDSLDVNLKVFHFEDWGIALFGAISS